MGKGKGKKGKKAAERPERPAKPAPSRYDGFTAERRDQFIAEIEAGASKAQAYRLVGISRQSVLEGWVNPGRTAEATYEQRDFVERLDKAVIFGTHENTKKLHKSEDPRVMIEIARARDSRFGDLDLRRKKQRVDIELGEIAKQKAQEELRTARAKADVAEAIAEKAKGQGQEIAFGLAAILSAEQLSETTRREVAEWAVRMGYVLVRSADLTGGANGSSTPPG